MTKYLVGLKKTDSFVEACYCALERCQESDETEIFAILDDCRPCVAIVRGTVIFAHSRSLLCHWDDEQQRVRKANRSSLLIELAARVKEQEDTTS